MKKNLLPFVFVLLIALSCQSSVEEQSYDASSEFTTYSIDIEAESIAFMDQIESVELLGFEESSESLLTANIRFLNYQEGYIVVDEGAGTVFIFNEDGTFKSKFNHKGQGPEEYSFMQHTEYRDGFIEIYVYSRRKMMRYNLEGDFIGAVDVPYEATDVIYFENGYLLGMGDQIGLDSVDHNLVLTDKEMKPYAYALPFSKPEGVVVKPPTNDFRIDGDRVLFNRFWTDSVYQISNDEVKPYIHFDFGDQWLWKEFPMSNSLNGKTINAMTDAGKVWAYEWILGTDRIEMTYMTSLALPPGIGYIDRKTKDFHNYSFDWFKQEGIPFRSIAIIDGKLMAVFSADTLSEMIEAIDQEKVEVKGFLSKEQILQSENPILVWIKLK